CRTGGQCVSRATRAIETWRTGAGCGVGVSVRRCAATQPTKRQPLGGSAARSGGRVPRAARCIETSQMALGLGGFGTPLRGYSTDEARAAARLLNRRRKSDCAGTQLTEPEPLGGSAARSGGRVPRAAPCIETNTVDEVGGFRYARCAGYSTGGG